MSKRRADNTINWNEFFNSTVYEKIRHSMLDSSNVTYVLWDIGIVETLSFNE
jgi:hypothetical protein